MTSTFDYPEREAPWFLTETGQRIGQRRIMGHHGRQAQTERTDHVVWPDGSNSPKTFSTLNLTWPTLATVHTTLPPRIHLAIMVSRVESLNQVRAIVLTFYRFGKSPLHQLCSVGL